jgi:putative tricarboxylic transport membrane protein
VKTQRRADIAMGCFVAVFGVFVLIAATMIPEMGTHRLSPRTFPYVVAFLLFFCGIALALKSWRLRGEDFKINWPDRAGVGTILVVLAILVGFVALMNPLGLPLSAFLYITISTWYLKPSKKLMAVVIGLVSGVFSYYIFIRLLALSFPAGFLEG